MEFAVEFLSGTFSVGQTVSIGHSHCIMSHINVEQWTTESILESFNFSVHIFQSLIQRAGLANGVDCAILRTTFSDEREQAEKGGLV